MGMNGTQMGDEVIAAIEAITDFPASGKTANTIDPRVIRAFCTAVVEHIQTNADVLPAAHSGEELSTALGTPSHGADPQGGTVNSTVTADTPIVGKGSIV